LYVLMRLRTTFNQIRWMAAGTIQPAIKDNDLMDIIVPNLDQNTKDKITKKVKEIEKARQKVKEELDEIGNIITS